MSNGKYSPPADIVRELGSNLASMISNADDAWAVGQVFQIISNREVARAWLVGMNPHLGNRSPFMEILADNAQGALSAARAYSRGDA